MITVTNRDTLKAAYVDPKNIQHIESLQDEIKGRAYPFSRIFIKDEKENHDYFLDVIDSKDKIDRLIKEQSEN